MRTVAILALLCASCASPPTCPGPAVPALAVDRRAEVEAFNRATIDATLRMDNEALLGLWEEDGVTLLPGSDPVVGKPAIRAMLQKVATELAGARMRSFEMHCAGLEISGDVATEYCDEHQIVDLPAGKPPFDGRGKLLYVLHRGEGGTWRLRREMWNGS
jgi:ketosteroid isomerase-like protein